MLSIPNVAHWTYANTQQIAFLQGLAYHQGLHVGELKWSCRSEDYRGWLVCDGRALSIAEYPALFDVIGTTFGGDGEATFALPDARARVLGAVGEGHGAGETVGEETHALSASEMPGHTHTGTTDAAGSHAHTTNAVGGSLGLATADGQNTVTGTDASANELNVWTPPRALTVDAAGSHTHTFTTASSGGGAAHNNMQPTVFIGSVLIFAGTPVEAAVA